MFNDCMNRCDGCCEACGKDVCNCRDREERWIRKDDRKISGGIYSPRDMRMDMRSHGGIIGRRSPMEISSSSSPSYMMGDGSKSNAKNMISISPRRVDSPLPSDAYQQLHATQSSVRSQTVEEKADRSRATEISRQTDRQWVAVTAYQPIDTVVKTVEVPVVRTIDTYVPKVTVEEKIVEVPKYVEEFVDKYIEVPEMKIEDKIVEELDYQHKYKYVTKTQVQENIIQRPKLEKKYIEKIVYVPEFKEVVRYNYIDAVEEVIKYVPKGEEIPTEAAKPVAAEKVSVTTEPEKSGRIEYPAEISSKGMYMPSADSTARTAFHEPSVRPPPDIAMPQIDQVFKPKVVQTVEIQKQVPVAVEVPVPYMVPKPIVVPVQVPVLKFRDHFVPVPVRRRVIPRIKWTNEIYEVECIKQKPFLQVQDVIKPVPCTVEINVHEFVEKAAPINPAELSQADIHAMWMRVNADLAEAKKEEYGDKYPYIEYPPGTVFNESATKKNIPDNDDNPPNADANANANANADNNAGNADNNAGNADNNAGNADGNANADNNAGNADNNAGNADNNADNNANSDGTTNGAVKEEEDKNDPEATKKQSMDKSELKQDEEDKNDDEMKKKKAQDNNNNNNNNNGGGGFLTGEDETIAIHPGHPLAMTYLQNQWLKRDTTRTHEMYTPEWFEAHQKALHTMTIQRPTQVELTAEQAAALQPQTHLFGEAPWLMRDERGFPMYPSDSSFIQSPPSHIYNSIQRSRKKCTSCQSLCCSGSCSTEPNPDNACCGPC